jgi:hypothetical protein
MCGYDRKPEPWSNRLLQLRNAADGNGEAESSSSTYGTILSYGRWKANRIRQNIERNECHMSLAGLFFCRQHARPWMIPFDCVLPLVMFPRRNDRRDTPHYPSHPIISAIDVGVEDRGPGSRTNRFDHFRFSRQALRWKKKGKSDRKVNDVRMHFFELSVLKAIRDSGFPSGGPS